MSGLVAWGQTLYRVTLRRFLSILLCEASMGGVSMRSRRAAAVLLDFAAAFPSLKHGWTLRVLRRVGVPIRIINRIMFFCSGQETFFVMSGEVVVEVRIGRGVKQGCPLSVLVVDPLLRRLAQGLGLLEHHIFAHADDLALLLRLLRAVLARLLWVFRRWEKISCLWLETRASWGASRSRQTFKVPATTRRR